MSGITSEKVDLHVDGSAMPAFTYTPEGRPEGNGPWPAVIMIQEIFGVNDEIKGFAARVAEAGYFAVAPDLYHRAGYNVVVAYGPDRDRARALRAQASADGIVADVRATVEHLAGDPHVDAGRIGIVGFCFGGMVSYLAAARVSGIKAAAVYYGGEIVPRPDAPPGTPSLLDETAADVQCPIIGFWGDHDHLIPVESVHKIEAALKAAGKSIENHIYEGAGHGFVWEDRPGHHAAGTKDAWSRTLGFFATHLAQPARV